MTEKRFLWGRIGHLLLLIALVWLCAMLAAYVCSIMFVKWYGIFFGLLLTGAAIPFHLAGRVYSLAYTAAILLNSLACGISISAYYSQQQLALQIPQVLTVMGWLFLLLTVIGVGCGLSGGGARGLTICGLGGGSALGFLALLVPMWWARSPASISHSYGFFITVFSGVCLVVLLDVCRNRRPPLRSLSAGCFAAYYILTVIVMLILTEGTMYR